MNPDLEHLIKLQSVESETDTARRALEEMPARRAAIEAALAEQEQAVAAARQLVADNQAARRSVEKDLAAAQSRLAKFKDQLMAVKTNKEYLAMQHGIAAADTDVKRREDQLLEGLLAADELAGQVKAAEATRATRSSEGAQALVSLDAEAARHEAAIASADDARRELAAAMPAQVLALFEQIRKNRGLAVAEARDGRCTACHVRLRPQVFNRILRGDTLVQCDSCQRVLFHRPVVVSPAATPSAS